MEEWDCVVVGAGWYGLAAAKQYRSLCPGDSLAVFESEATLGGTWADHRLYPGLKSNNLLGTYEYPDFPMDSVEFNIKPGEYIPGNVINTYLKSYASKFGITDLIRFNTEVLTAEHQDTPDGGWMLTVADSKTGTTRTFTRRLIMATGLTSQAFIPHFKGQESFGGRIFHAKHFLQNKDTIEKGKSVTVLGGAKSAWDAVHVYATAGVKVNWVIRSSGHGPCWMSPSFVTPFKKWIEKLANVRFLTWFSPCIWGDVDGYGLIRRFLHGTILGRVLVNNFWKLLGNDVLTLNKYDAHPKTAKLKPWTEAMFTATSFSILNYDSDFFELVKSDMVDIHTSDIDLLSARKVHLADGTEFESDAVLANTGWKHVPTVRFLPEGIEGELGVPHVPMEVAPVKDLANQESLIDKADREILQRFPRLKNQPVWNKNYVPLTDQKGIDSDDDASPYQDLTAYMLHRFLVPPSERFLRSRDTAFVGIVSNFSNTITAHLQGLWVSAYFSGRLSYDPSAAVGDRASMESLQYETVLHNRFGKWRYPTDWGSKKPAFIFDVVPYLDLLQRDLGLVPYRKAGIWSEVWHPYGPEDYRNINEEWQNRLGGDKLAATP